MVIRFLFYERKGTKIKSFWSLPTKKAPPIGDAGFCLVVEAIYGLS